jgi:flagellar biosynthesis protein FlhF
MKVEQFIAESAVDAVEQIRSQLGPQAVVVDVRPLPNHFWQKRRFEVLAYMPEPSAPKQEDAPAEIEPPPCNDGHWNISAVLENIGLLPVHGARIVENLQATHGDGSSVSLTEELALTRAMLTRLWKPANHAANSKLHVFVGAPGVGKTTALCKWLTNAVLLGGSSARVWRLDGHTANAAESLSVHGEILGVAVERSWMGGEIDEQIGFVDLPGVAWMDAAALQELAEQVKQFSAAHVHLVLNAAYESAQLLAQTRAFAALPVTDLIVTHLDEETRWGKLWNLVLGTDYPIRYLAAGQNIPGGFTEASAEHLLARHFPVK